MGWVDQSDPEKGGAYLLDLLKREGCVRYSRFYGDDVDPEALAAATGLDEEHAHVIIEFAAGQLEGAGVVSFAELPEKLIDDEQDYLISLTHRGRKLVEDGQRLRCRHMEPCPHGSPA